MTLIAGVFSRGNSPIDEAVLTIIRKNLSRNPADKVEVYQNKRVCLMKVDIGVFGVPALVRDRSDGSVTFATGEPLLGIGDGCRPRDVDVEIIHHDLQAGSLSSLKSATGIFSIAHYHAPSGTLTLATDKIGHRAIYYWVDEERIVFSSVMRVLESLPFSKTMNVLALAEMTVYPKHPLGSRTPYCEIKRMLSGEVLQFSGKKVRSQLYFDFGSVQQVSTADEESCLHEAHERFMSAVRRRLRSQQAAAACLSGGLDSRAVVSGLRALDTRVYTVNMYQFHNSQDRVYAEMLARAAGTVHTEAHVPEFVWGQKFECTAMETYTTAVARNGEELEHPQILWTGHGGSVSSGHLHIEQGLADMLRQGRMKDAFRSYHLGGINRRILTKAAEQIEELMFEAFLNEMRTIQCPDPARAFHVFLIKNHQRKDFVQHFEYIDMHRLEFQSPFYDSHYLESIVRLPFEWTVAHRFYHKWMRLFPPFATSVPWQTYEGHEPCPLPSVPGVARQWDEETLAVGAKARQAGLVRRARKALFAKRFPSRFVRRDRLMMAALLQWSRLRFCGTAINIAATFCDYWNRCDGAYAMADIDQQSSPFREPVSSIGVAGAND
ncbi:MAG TPA: asparagine synthase-related protein [Terriglobales bacterium]|nr:asparagine synthase-related protein [Terriglobales bacterium]